MEIKNKPENNSLQKLKEYLIHSTTILNVDKKIATLILMYCFDKSEKKEYENDFLIFAKEMKIDKPLHKINLQLYMSYHEYTKFVKKLFIAAITEYKSKLVSFHTSALFRLISDLIDLMTIWKFLGIEEKWKKRSIISLKNIYLIL